MSRAELYQRIINGDKEEVAAARNELIKTILAERKVLISDDGLIKLFEAFFEEGAAFAVSIYEPRMASINARMDQMTKVTDNNAQTLAALEQQVLNPGDQPLN